MAGVGEEEVDYESDPEEAKISLTMRRREASDDEEEAEEEDGIRPRRIESRAGIVSDYESDGQGAAADYDDDEESEIEEEEEVEDEVDEYEERVEDASAVVKEEIVEFEGDGRRSVGESTEIHGLNEMEGEKKGNETIEEPIEGEYYASNDQDNVAGGRGGEEEKKENEPFAVPTAGAFYMHDDRFRDSAGGRHRRTLGGRKLWESKDDKKWGHDKFEEMTMQERHYEEGRRGSRGRYRARGKNRGEDSGYPRANRSKAYNNNNQNNAPKGVRGRGPRRYRPSTMNNSEGPIQNRQPGKSVEKTSYASSGRASAPASNVESNPAPSRRNVFASSLSSASPPFYPSGSSNKEVTSTQKRDAQTVPIKSFSVPQSHTMRGKNVADSVGMDKLYIDDSVSPLARKPLNNMQLSHSGSSLVNSTTQSPQSRVQGRGLSPSGQVAYQTSTPHNQVNRVSPPTHVHTDQRAPPVQSRLQPTLQASGQQFGQRPGSGSQVSSPPKTALSVNSFESGETECLSESSKSKTALVGKGKGSVQGSGRGSFPYGGAQVIGGGHGGDQNFPGTPAFLPVMQFGGQHPGGMGVPAVGMAFPGYVAQPQLGLGNSEMTWLPVLAGAAGALGATYCPPYLAVDGGYHARPSGQTSSLSAVSSKENSTNRPGNELKSSQRPELANDEFGQRQNKPRRYTEMKFDQ